MGWFAERRQSDNDHPGILVKSVPRAIQLVQNDRSRRYRFIPSTASRFEVISTETLKNTSLNWIRQPAAAVLGNQQDIHAHTLSLSSLVVERILNYTPKPFSLDGSLQKHLCPL